MSQKKAGGSSKNGRDSRAKRLGVKKYGGEAVSAGAIIVRQRGTKMVAGSNVSVGRDHSLFATAAGSVRFDVQPKQRFDGRMYRRTRVSVEAGE